MKPNTAFSFIKNNVLSPADSRLYRLYLPIIGGDAVLLYSVLLSFYDHGEHSWLIGQMMNHLDMGLPRFLAAWDRLIAMGLLDAYESGEALQVQLHAPKDAEEFFNNSIYRRLLERNIGEKAVQDLLPQTPQGEARQVSFSQLFSMDQPLPTRQNKEKNQFDVDHFKQLMGRDGLRFMNESEDILALFAIAEEKGWAWYETYLLAKETAIDRVISTVRMKQKLGQTATPMNYSQQEQTIIREAKRKSSLQFLAEIKKTRKATITQSERKTLRALADLGLLDEVINVIVLLTFNKVSSANLNEKYALKVGNDFAYQQIVSAEEAVVKVRERQERKAKQPGQDKKGASRPTNVPKWSQPNYQNQTSQEERNDLEREKQRLLEQLNQGGE